MPDFVVRDMSLLMFSETHLEQILSGEKTQTRRLWDAPRVTVGNSYRAVRSDVSGAMFTKREDAPAYVVIEDVWSEPLEELTEEDAAKEGNYTREEFIEEWKRIHGEWNPEQTVYVIEFTGFEEDPRTP